MYFSAPISFFLVLNINKTNFKKSTCRGNKEEPGNTLTGMCMTILSFFRLLSERQYDYVLTSQKRASDWLKISRQFS